MKFLLAFLAAFAAVSAAALADGAAPAPGVARISVINGNVTIKHGETGDSVAASANAPLEVGDYLTTDNGARAEVQLSPGVMVRAGSATQLRISRLDPATHGVQLAAGTVELRVMHSLDAHPQIDTPSITVRPSEPGAYRVEVRGDATTSITVRSGRTDVVAPQNTQSLAGGSTELVKGPNSNPQYQTVAIAPADDFDRWNDARDGELARAHSKYDPNVIGAGDLDAYGHWTWTPDYGTVWVPSVAPGWAPYSSGNWAWEPYYGWTWVGYEPWGWAPYHYGRWFYNSTVGWCWWPGPDRVWQPGIVAFFGFGAFSIGWVPLAPFEPYNPWWGPGVNVVNVYNVTNVTNVVNVYRNGVVPGAISGMPGKRFVENKNTPITRVPPSSLVKAHVAPPGTPVVPSAPIARSPQNATPPRTAFVPPISAVFHTFPAVQPPGAAAAPRSVQSVWRRFDSSAATVTHPAPAAPARPEVWGRFPNAATTAPGASHTAQSVPRAPSHDSVQPARATRSSPSESSSSSHAGSSPSESRRSATDRAAR